MIGTQARKIDARAICSPEAASEAASAPIGMFSAPAGDPCESAGISAHPLTPARKANDRNCIPLCQFHHTRPADCATKPAHLLT